MSRDYSKEFEKKETLEALIYTTLAAVKGMGRDVRGCESDLLVLTGVLHLRSRCKCCGKEPRICAAETCLNCTYRHSGGMIEGDPEDNPEDTVDHFSDHIGSRMTEGFRMLAPHNSFQF